MLKNIVIILLVAFVHVLSQEYGTYWFLKNSYGVSFNEACDASFRITNKFPSTNNLNKIPGPSTVVIEDSVGNPLFYTDGFTIWNKDLQIIENGDTLIPFSQNQLPDGCPRYHFHPNLSQRDVPYDNPVIFCRVWKPSNQKHLYYIISGIWGYTFYQKSLDCDSLARIYWEVDSIMYPLKGMHIYYSIVDISENNGLGKVISKGLPLIIDYRKMEKFEILPFNGDKFLLAVTSVYKTFFDGARVVRDSSRFEIFEVYPNQNGELEINKILDNSEHPFGVITSFVKTPYNNKLFLVVFPLRPDYYTRAYGTKKYSQDPYPRWWLHEYYTQFVVRKLYPPYPPNWSEVFLPYHFVPNFSVYSGLVFTDSNRIYYSPIIMERPRSCEAQQAVISNFSISNLLNRKFDESVDSLKIIRSAPIGFSPNFSKIYFSMQDCSFEPIIMHISQYQIESSNPFKFSRKQPKIIQLDNRKFKGIFKDTSLKPYIFPLQLIGYDYYGSMYCFALVGGTPSYTEKYIYQIGDEPKQWTYYPVLKELKFFIMKIENANDTNFTVVEDFLEIKPSSVVDSAVMAWRSLTSLPQGKYHLLYYDKLCLNGILHLQLSPFVPFDVRESIERVEWSGPNGFYSEESEPRIPFFTSEKEGWYRVKIYSAIDTLSDSVYVRIRRSSITVSNSKVEKCPNESVVLRVSGGTDYQWSTGESGDSILVTEPGWYSARGYDSCGCLTIDSVLVVDKPVVLEYPKEVDFGSVYLGKQKDTTIRIINRSECKLKIKGFNFASDNEFIEVKYNYPDFYELNPNGIVEIPISFSPKKLGRHRGEIKIEVDKLISEIIEINIMGIGKSKISLFIPDTALQIGKQMCLPLATRGLIGMPIEERVNWSVEVSFDTRLLETGQGIIDNGKRKVNLTGTMEYLDEDTLNLSAVCGRVLLSSVQQSINVEDYDFGEFIEVEKKDGLIRLIGICEPELSETESFQPVELELIPNPASNELEVRIKGQSDYGYVLRFLTLEGREILRKEGKLESGIGILKLDTEQLGSGVLVVDCIVGLGHTSRLLVISR